MIPEIETTTGYSGKNYAFSKVHESELKCRSAWVDITTGNKFNNRSLSVFFVCDWLELMGENFNVRIPLIPLISNKTRLKRSPVPQFTNRAAIARHNATNHCQSERLPECNEFVDEQLLTRACVARAHQFVASQSNTFDGKWFFRSEATEVDLLLACSWDELRVVTSRDEATSVPTPACVTSHRKQQQHLLKGKRNRNICFGLGGRFARVSNYVTKTQTKLLETDTDHL